MEKIFLIGGSGFIGKNLVEHFAPSYEVHIIDKYIDKDFFSKLPPPYRIFTLKNDIVVDEIPADYPSPDYIINLASIVTAERDMSLFGTLLNTNLEVLLHLYNRYKNDKNLKLFVQFGSSEEYGNYGSPFQETQREVPTSPYALVKQLVVNTALMLHADYGFPTMAVRPGNVFGKYQSTTKFIPYVIKQLRANEPLNVTYCEQKRDCIYAEDFAWCLGEIVKHYDKAVGEIVNLGSGDSTALKDIIEFCRQYTNSSSVVNYGALPYRANEVMDLRCSEYKLSSIIGQPIKFNIYERLKQYIDTFNSSLIL